MTAAPRGSVRAQLRTSLVPMAVEGARPRPARNSAATPSYPLDRSVIAELFRSLGPNGRFQPYAKRVGWKPLLGGVYFGPDLVVISSRILIRIPTPRKATWPDT